MDKYSTRDSAAFDELIDQHMERIANDVWASPFSNHWKALVLLGYRRGEGTSLITPSRTEQPFNDYNLIVVTTRIDRAIKNELKQFEVELSDKLGQPVGLYPYLKSSLPSCEFSLLNYELKYGHRVIRGDPNILDRMPNYPHDAIPLSEGTRLLMNRGKLLLDVKTRLATGEPLTHEERIRFIKFIFKANLAFGDCVLLMRNEYDLSYTIKKERIRTINLGSIQDARGLISAYLQAIEFEESGNITPHENANIHVWIDMATRRFLDVFLWYERRTANRKFRNIRTYATSFPTLRNEGSRLKNIALNLRSFGIKAFPHLTMHPRRRLYPAIALLLDDSAHLPHIRHLLCSRHETYSELCNHFRTLQQRFS